MRELLVLGSGTAIPTRRRGPTGSLIVDDDDVTLVDPGPGTLKRACDAGFPVERIKRVLLTHHHPDHCLDVVSLLFARKIPLLDELCGPLQLIGGPGTRDLLRRFRDVFGEWITLPDGRLEEREIGPGPFALSERIRGNAIAIDHSSASLGYQLEFEDGTRLGLSGDTDDCPGAIEVGRDVDHYLLEAALPDGMYRKGHLTPSRAARIASRAGCRHLILTHFYPPVDVEEARERAHSVFTGRVTIAEDGLRVPLLPEVR